MPTLRIRLDTVSLPQDIWEGWAPWRRMLETREVVLQHAELMEKPEPGLACRAKELSCSVCKMLGMGGAFQMKINLVNTEAMYR